MAATRRPAWLRDPVLSHPHKDRELDPFNHHGRPMGWYPTRQPTSLSDSAVRHPHKDLWPRLIAPSQRPGTGPVKPVTRHRASADPSERRRSTSHRRRSNDVVRRTKTNEQRPTGTVAHRRAHVRRASTNTPPLATNAQRLALCGNLSISRVVSVTKSVLLTSVYLYIANI